MKKKLRLKTTTPENKVFLSPFVFGKEEAQRRLMKPTLKERAGTMIELLEVTNYPSIAVWSERRHGKCSITIETLRSKISVIEERWEVMKSANIRKDA